MALPNVNKNLLLIVLALAVGGGAIYLSNKVIRDKISQIEEESKRGKKLVKIVVPTKDLEKGDALSAQVVAVREVPQEFVSHLSITPDKFDEVENQRLATSIKRGEALLEMHTEGQGSRVFSAGLRKGTRALTFEVDEVNSISGMLRPGDRIDLVLTAKTTGSTSGVDVTFPMLSDVIVLATGQTVTKQDPKDGRERSFSTITLELRPEDAHRIIVAKSSGRLTAVLRNPDDRARNTTQPLTINDVVAGNGQGGVGRTVEYLVGGGGGPAPVATLALGRAKPDALPGTGAKPILDALQKSATTAGADAVPRAPPSTQSNMTTPAAAPIAVPTLQPGRP
jgi:pilus assembly protein CpaB